MGYRTPNIDRIAKEGALFTDVYAQQSCTAGRAAFITGQSCFRTGLLKVGLPGAHEGLSQKDPTIPGLVKSLGYATGQFGKNHLGDRNEHLPTVNGFDEFYGNLAALRCDRWKMLFMEQRAIGFDVWQEPLVTLRLPKVFDLRGSHLHLRRLRPLAHRSRVPARARPGLRGPAPRKLPRVSAPAKARQFFARSSAGETPGRRRQQTLRLRGSQSYHRFDCETRGPSPTRRPANSCAGISSACSTFA
jgi:Sulfatase